MHPGCEAVVGEALTSALSRCPFLHSVSTAHGEEFARRLALNPFQPAGTCPRPPVFLEDAAASFAAVVNLFHGKRGAVPLANMAPRMPTEPPPSCRAQEQALSPSRALLKPLPQAATVHPLGALPVACISLSGFGFMPNPGDFFRRLKRQQRARKRRRHSQRSHKQQQPQQQRPGAAAGATSPPAGSGRCPMRSIFGPLGGLLPLSAAGRLQCPPAITAMRAAVAGLKPVRDLRPHGLPVKSLALAATTIAANVPCGAWREHTDKFSVQWLVAVHATIPFIAMLRKAVLMPNWAILLTVAGAVAGQQAGAQMERRRLAALAARHGRGAGAGGAAEGVVVAPPALAPQVLA